MALFDPSTNELTAKIVYYGPGLSGKTSNLIFIHDNMPEDERGKMLSLSTEADRTILFDFMPLEMGKARGVNIRIQLYTVPGQVFYEETRRKVLKGADGVVFVADSQKKGRDANVHSFRQLKEHLKECGNSLEEIPLLLQYNKRDLPDTLSLEEIDELLNPGNTPFFEAVATEGIGVEDTLKAISSLVLRKIFSKPLDTLARSQPEEAFEEITATDEVEAEELPVGEGSLFGESPEMVEAASLTGNLEVALPSEETEDSAEMLFPEEAGGLEEAEEEADNKEDASQETGGGLDDPSLQEPPAPLAIVPGQPFQTVLDIAGARFTLTIKIEPVPDE